MRVPNLAEHKPTDELYRSVVELAPDSIVTVDMKGMITSCNTAATRILGYSKDELIGKHFSRVGVIRTKDIPKFLKLFKSALRGEVTEPLELTFYHKDGTPILAEVRVSVLKEGGKTIGLQAVSRDITERKRTEEALRESEERLRAQYKGIPVPAYTWQRVGEDFTLVDYNDAAEAITQGNVARFVGEKASRMYRDRPDIIEDLSRCLTERIIVEREMEYRFTTTGETKHLAVSYAFVPPNLVMVHTEDITERKRTEREIEERRLYLEAVLTAAPDAIVTLDSRHRIVEWNPGAERLFGYSREEVIGESLDRLVTNPDTYEEAVGFTQIVMSGKHLPRVETVRYRKDGSPVDVIVAGSPVLVRGELIGVVAVYTDITELKRTDEALRQSEERLSVFMDSAPDAFALFDSELDLVEVNRVALGMFPAGTRKEDVVGKNITELYPNMMETGRYDKYLEVVRTGKSFFVDDVVPNPRFGDAHLAVRAFKVGDGLGIIVRDITERKQAEEEIRRRTEELAALYDVSLDVAAQLDLDTLLKTILLRAMELLGANAGGLYLYHPERQELELIVHQGLRKDYRGIRLALGEGACGKVAQSGEPLVVTDYSNWEGRSSHFADEPTFNVLAVPIKRGDTLLGALYVDDPDAERRFEGGDVRLATLFANQAAIAMENARLYEEEREQREEAETLRQATQALSTTLDLLEVFESILSELQRVVPYDSASVQLLKGDRLEIIGGYGFPNLDELLGLSFPLDGENPNRRVVASRAPFIVEDAPAVYNAFREEPHAQAGIRAWLGVPLLFGDRLIGMIALDKRMPGFYTEEHARLALAFAAQAAVAIENARLYEETQRRLRELRMLHQASASIVSTLELDKTLQLIMDLAVKAIPSAQKGSLHLLDEERNELVMRAGYGFSLEVMEAATFKVGEGYAGWAFAHNHPVIIDNVTTDARFKPIDLPEVQEEKSAICTPLVVKGKTIGTITLDNVTSYGAFDEDDVQLLSAFADQAAIAIENAGLYEETKRLAATDPLTGVWNRRHIGERLRTEVARARRFHHPLSVLVMDIDDLKLFNDTYGHVTGDKVIRTVAQAVLTSCREIDIVGRYGGDEFAVILPEADARGAAIVAGRILAALETEPFQASNGTKVPINISIGAASYPSDSEEADRLFSLADAAMYRAKVAGGGQFASLTVGPEEVSEEPEAPFDVLQGLLISVDAKDRYTFKHSQEVTERALALARAVGASEEEMRALEIAGRLHDVGKIGIPTHVLRKPGPLTAEEWQIVQQHPRLGYMILQQLPQMETVLQSVLYHHERWDGNGYPEGLKGKQIPKLARILAIADAYSAMQTDRPYRKAFSREEAVQEIRNCAGTQFDPELAEIFLDLISGKREQEG